MTVAEGLDMRGDRRLVVLASMGPQLDSCGRWSEVYKEIPMAQLQWGRNLTVAEGATYTDEGRVKFALQWGRNLTVAEGGTELLEQRPKQRFNGAAT